MRSNRHHKCPVCGFPELAEPARDKQGNGSFEICPSCGTEFGYDDAAQSFEKLRLHWLEKGAVWWSTAHKKPKDWNPVMQLRKARLLKVAPDAHFVVGSSGGQRAR